MKKISQKNSPPDGAPFPQRKPRLLFVGEGPDDIGRDVKPGGAAAGFLQSSLTAPGDPDAIDELAFTIARVQRWVTLRIPRPRTTRLSFEDVVAIDSEGMRVLAALVVAQAQELDGVFVLKDCEQEGRFNLQKTLRHARTVFEKNNPSAERPRLVVATPSRVHETWLLADANAVESVFGSDGIYRFSKSPEDRPHGDELKSHIESHSLRCHLKPHEARRQLASRASPKTLSTRCPKCYPSFLKDVEDELKPLIRL